MTTSVQEQAGKVFARCPKCDGKGVIRAFAHVAGGQCFACLGNGGEWITQSTLDRRAKDRARRKAKRERDEVARVEAYVTGYMSEAIAAGVPAQEVHDERCSCRGFCWTTYRDGAQGKRWVSLGGTL